VFRWWFAAEPFPAGSRRETNRFLSVPHGIITIVVRFTADERGEFYVADSKSVPEQAGKASGVIPVQFSAGTETHDEAVMAVDRDATWRSPFSSDGLRPASGE
jgi:hypothetical protein